MLGAHINCCVGDIYYNVTTDMCRDPWSNTTTPNLLGCDAYYVHINGTFGISFLLKDTAILVEWDSNTEYLKLDK